MSIVEKVWTEEDKLVWALVFSIQRWMSYLLRRTIIVIVLTSCTKLPRMLRFMGDSARVKRWIVIIQEFEVCFLTEETATSKMENVNTYKEPFPTKNAKEIDAQVNPNNKVEIMLKGIEVLLYFDGSFKPKTKVAGVGYVFMDREYHGLWSGNDHSEANSLNHST